MKKHIVCLSSLLLIFLMLTACGQTGKLRRRDPYTKEEYEAYLEDKYGEAFTILSREEVYSLDVLQKIEYEVQADQDSDFVFHASDINDGFAGWTLYDDYEQVQEEQEPD